LSHYEVVRIIGQSKRAGCDGDRVQQKCVHEIPKARI
jgi:hypothetical protein